MLFTTPPRTVLKPSFSYKVQIYNTVTKYKTTGQTDMVDALSLSNIPNDPTNDIILPLACTDPGCIRDFNTFGSGVQFNRAGNVARVQINILVPWRETAPNGDTAYRSLVWNFYPDAPQIPSAGLFSQQLRGDDAYALANLLLQNVDTTKDVVRTFHNFTITIATGNQIISDYIQTGKAYSPISQTRPFYSNVVGGLGVVGSRNQFSFTVKPDGGIVNLQRASNTGQPSRYAKLRFR